MVARLTKGSGLISRPAFGVRPEQQVLQARRDLRDFDRFAVYKVLGSAFRA
jgi:hypothetical protein